MENAIEKEIEEESQDKILESLSAKDYYNIILPKDDFFDFQSVSSFSENDRIRYLCETVFENSKGIKFIDRVDINKLTVYDRSLSWFDDNLFDILLKFCKQDTKNIIFHPDYIINNIEGQKLKEKIKKYKENIHCFKDWIKDDKTYDLIGEVSIDFFPTSKNSKLLQTRKFINIIKLIEDIEGCKNIETIIKSEFEKQLGLVNGNEKILVLTSDGNYEKLNMPQTFLKELKTSGIHFIIIYVPRSYVNVKKINSKDEEIEKMKKEMDDLKHRLELLENKENKEKKNN